MIGLALVKSIIPFSFLISLPERNPPKNPKWQKKKERNDILFSFPSFRFLSLTAGHALEPYSRFNYCLSATQTHHHVSHTAAADILLYF